MIQNSCVSGHELWGRIPTRPNNTTAKATLSFSDHLLLRSCHIFASFLCCWRLQHINVSYFIYSIVWAIVIFHLIDFLSVSDKVSCVYFVWNLVMVAFSCVKLYKQILHNKTQRKRADWLCKKLLKLRFNLI